MGHIVRRTKVTADNPAVVRIGSATLTIKRIGPVGVVIAVEAPGQEVRIEDSRTAHVIVNRD